MTKLIRYLISQYWKYKFQSMGILLCIIISLTFHSFYSLSFSYLIDRIIPGHHFGYLFVLLWCLLGGYVIHLAGQWLRERWLSRIAVSMLNDLRLSMFGHLQKLPVSYYGRVSKGSLISRFTNDLSSIHTSFVAIVPAAYSILSITAYIGVTTSFHWSLAVLSFLGISLSLILPIYISQIAVRLNDILKTRQNILLEYIQEHFAIHKTVRAYNLQEWEFNRLQVETDKLYPLAVKSHATSRYAPVSVSLALLFINIAVITSGAYLVMRNYISVGMLIAFQSLFLAMSQQVRELIQHLPSLTSATASYMRIQRLLSEHKEEDGQPGKEAIHVAKVDKEISLQGVSFAYNPENPVIEKLDLIVPASNYVAIIGMNGSGKSTVVNLLLRFYEPTEGRVEFDGKDAREISADSLRNMMGYVPQDAELMNLSIRDNIRLGKPDATEDEIIEAAKAAGIHDWISRLPDGFQTSCGEDGHALSGGQKQRIAIARVLVRNPGIILLDEATSALDPESETIINNTIQGLAGSKTIINVTHRLSTVTNADIIFLMDKGRLIHGGNHEQMLAESELYRLLWNKQSGFVISGDGRNAQIDAGRLKKIPLFDGLDEQFLDYVSQCLGTEYMQAGEIVVERGGEGDKFYIVVRGQIEVLKPKPGFSEEVRVSVLEDGDHFGEISLMMSMPRTATIRTLTPCTFLTIQRSLFQNILEKAAPELRWRLEQSCRERMTY
jgi:ATP-binding cassette subfamily B protein